MNQYESSVDRAKTAPALPESMQFVTLLLSHRRRLLIYPVAIAVVVVAMSFLIPNEYRSHVIILPPERDFQSMTDMLSGVPNLFATEMVLPFMATPSDILAVVLESQTVRDSVTEIMDLPRRWDVTPVKASAILKERLELKVHETGIVEASFTGTERWFNDSLINALASAADQLNQSIANSKARRTREFVERRLTETEDDLRRASDSLEVFQNEHRTVALDHEIAALVQNAADLRAQITADEIQLSVLRETLSRDHPRVRALQTRIAETRRKARDLESPNSGDSTRSFLGMGLTELPQLTQQLAARMRNVRVAETLYELLVQQFEQARIQERRDTPTFSVLDWATHGGKKVRPRRSIIGMVTLVMSFGVVVAFLLGREYFQRLEEARPDQYQAWNALWRMVRKPGKHLDQGVTK